MPQRNSSTTTDHHLISATTPRRSPRLLANIHIKPVDPNTPDPESNTTHTRPSATPNGSLKKPLKSKKVEELAHGSELNEDLSTGSKRSAALSADIGLRRSTRLSGNQEVKSLNQSLDVAELANDICELDSLKTPQIGNRVTRNCGRLNGVKCVKNSLGDGFNEMESSCLEVAEKTTNSGVSSRKKLQRKLGKRVKGNSNGSNGSKCVKNTCGDGSNGSKCVKNSLGHGFNEMETSCLEVSEDGVAEKTANSGVSSSKKLHRRLGSSNSSNASKCAKNTSGNGFHEMGNSCFEASDEVVIMKREKLGVSTSKKLQGKSGNKRKASSAATRVEKEKGADIDKGNEVVRVKRKRNQIEGSPRIVQGWTKDQELALQRAYFAAKPTPHFWKTVSKLVPGKTAQECFDKVNADHLTPPQPRTRTRARTTASPSSLSESRLLKSSEPKLKKTSHKRKSCVAQKTVRQILEKHYNVDQHYEADLFSVLEGVSVSTPECGLGKPQYMKKSAERSSSAHKKQRSRLGIFREAELVSPPVLKKVKNKALHEKYIDKLHTRDAKRRAASARASMGVPVTNPLKLDAVKAARNALVLDAKDVIHQFQHLKETTTRKSPDFDDEEMDWDDEEEGAEDD